MNDTQKKMGDDIVAKLRGNNPMTGFNYKAQLFGHFVTFEEPDMLEEVCHIDECPNLNNDQCDVNIYNFNDVSKYIHETYGYNVLTLIGIDWNSDQYRFVVGLFENEDLQTAVAEGEKITGWFFDDTFTEDINGDDVGEGFGQYLEDEETDEEDDDDEGENRTEDDEVEPAYGHIVFNVDESKINWAVKGGQDEDK